MAAIRRIRLLMSEKRNKQPNINSMPIISLATITDAFQLIKVVPTRIYSNGSIGKSLE
jgi:hypothetical protein